MPVRLTCKKCNKTTNVAITVAWTKCDCGETIVNDEWIKGVSYLGCNTDGSLVYPIKIKWGLSDLLAPEAIARAISKIRKK